MFEHIEPTLLPRQAGGWLAVSERSAPIRIGVIGLSQEDARDKFRAEAREWGALLDEAPGESPA